MMDQLKDACKYFQWGPIEQSNFDKLKVALATRPSLAIVDPHKPFVVETDARARAAGAVLLQEGCPIAFESKNLNRDQ